MVLNIVIGKCSNTKGTEILTFTCHHKFDSRTNLNAIIIESSIKIKEKIIMQQGNLIKYIKLIAL